MKFRRMPIEIEAPEEMGVGVVKYNLTESSYSDQKFNDLALDLSKVTFFYGPHRGPDELRELIAKSGRCAKEDVLVTSGASAALFLIATSLVGEGDHVIVQYPNYGSNIETPRLLGCDVELMTCYQENNYQVTLEDIKKRVKPNTKLISIASPHNPSGTHTPWKLLEEIAAFAKEKNIFFLVDETYGDLNFAESHPYASTINENVISVSSLSKTYGLPGIRIGWLTTKNKELQELFLAAKEQVFISGSVVDEEIATQVLRKKDTFLEVAKKDILKKQKMVMDWLKTETSLDCATPTAGVCVFLKFKKQVDLKKFYEVMNQEFFTYVGPGRWFEMPDDYFRLGYAWPTTEELSIGLESISKAIVKATKS